MTVEESRKKRQTEVGESDIYDFTGSRILNLCKRKIGYVLGILWTAVEYRNLRYISAF